MTSLVDKIVAVHRALEQAAVPHAFGGALALAWCTERARGTIDIDVNILAGSDQVEVVLEALPKSVRWGPDDVAALRRAGQTRLWWDETPLDVFFDTTAFHRTLGERVRVEQFAGADVPFLGCSDLAVFKAFFDRTKDWADIEEMVAAGTLDVDRTLGVVVRYLGGDDHRVARLRGLAGTD